MGVLLSLPLGLEDEEEKKQEFVVCPKVRIRPGAVPGPNARPGVLVGLGSGCGRGVILGAGVMGRDGSGSRGRSRGGTVRRGRRPYSRRVFRNRTSYLNLSEEQCVQRLGFSREAVTELCLLVQAQLQPRTRAWTALPVAVKVTVALNFYTTGSFQAATGIINDITQFAIHCCIRDVTEVLYDKRNQFISFPMERESQEQRELGFRKIAGFPGVQGVLGCVHVALRAPYDNPGVYINAKGFHSLKVQLVCDHRHRVMHVCSRFPGGTCQSFILQESSVPPLFEPECQVSGWLLGSSDYPLTPWLMTPIRNPRSSSEHQYNCRHACSHGSIRRTIAMLKHRFRCLSRSGGSLQYSPDRVSKFIVVCCMLHNFALERGQELRTPEGLQEEEEEWEGEECEWEKEEEEGERSPNLITAIALRQCIIQGFS